MPNSPCRAASPTPPAAAATVVAASATPLARLVSRLVTAFLLVATSTALLTATAAPASAADTIAWGAGSQQAMNQAPFSARSQVNGIACPTAGLCVAVTEFGGIFTSPGTAGPWTARLTLRQERFQDVSCATTTMCIAVTTSGAVYGTTTPTGTWQAIATAANELRAVSCPTTTLCVAAGRHPIGGGVAVSTDPLNSSAWQGGSWAFALGTFVEVECVVEAPRTLCMAFDGSGHHKVTQVAAPTATGDWQNSGGSSNPVTLSCVSITDCIALDRDGDMAVMTNPGVFGPLDRPQPADPAPKVDCPTVDLCLEVTSVGIARRHLEPSRYVDYSETTTHAAGMSAVECVKGTTNCAIGTRDGRIISSPDAAKAPAATWTTGTAMEPSTASRTLTALPPQPASPSTTPAT